MASESDSDPLTQYSHTHRIVLLIDLTPLHNNHFTKRIVSFMETLVSFPPLSTSLFAFKLFFSSLSPLLSFSKLQPFLPNPTLSFDTPSSTLSHLSHTLSSLPPSFHPFSTSPNASHLAESLSQLLHDHSWDRPDTDPRPVPPNLVLLFSPSLPSLSSLASFLDTDASNLLTSLRQTLSSVFASVGRAFASRAIHCSWIDIDSQIGRIENDDEAREVSCLLEAGVAGLGWGFCSLDSILLGSALVPFGLVYPKIGVSWGSLNCSSSSRDAAQLSLRMLDVNGSPIEYNCCDLEFVDVKVLGGSGDLNFRGCGRKEGFWKLCSEGGVKLDVKIMRKCDMFVGIEEWLSDSVLVREDFRGLKKKEKGGLDDFFVDRVLELVASEFGCEWRQKQVPVWEMLLSFLYREGCWVLVSVTNGKGGSCIGILRPFTVFTALLSVLGDPQGACGFGEANVGQYVRMVDGDKKEELLDSHGRPRKKMLGLKALRDFTWSSFCNSVYDQFEANLLEVYYAMEGNKSNKKLKFLKCWIKQMKKSGCSDLTLLEKPKPNPIVAEEASGRLNDLPQNAEHPISSAEINPDPEASRIREDAVLDFRSETSETFFSNLAERINRGVESEVIDMGALAERLVNSSIYWLSQKVDREAISQSQSPLKDHNASCGSMIASELIKLLLLEPEDISAKQKSKLPLYQSILFDPRPSLADSEVRGYELQILFRMEILQSEVGSEVKDSCKQKFVKEICLLLQNIQYHMGVVFFGDWTLEKYVTDIIKNRYSLTLEDVVRKIDNKLDLLLFVDEDEAPNSLLNSEDSNKSVKKKTYRDKVGENDVSSEPISAENEPFQLQNDGSGRFQRTVHYDNKKLIEAKEKRERAQRFSSFTSSMPVLRRVRATKQKGMKPKTDLLQRVPKGKERERANYGTVCETPMTENKRSRARNSDDDNGLAHRSQPCGSVSKALFMDDL